MASQAFEPDEQLIKSSYEIDQSCIRGGNNDTAKSRSAHFTASEATCVTEIIAVGQDVNLRNGVQRFGAS